MKTVLITGASGLMGRAAVDMLLNKGFKVIATDKVSNPFQSQPEVEYVQCLVMDKNKLMGVMNSKKVDALVHLACTIDNDYPAILTPENERESAAVDKFLYKTAEAAGVSDILMVSTHLVYASQKTREPIRETMDEKPVTVYAKLKSNSEDALAAALKRSTATRGVIMRVCPVYTKDFTDNLKAKVYDPNEGCAYVYGYGDYGYSFTCLYNLTDFIYGILTSSKDITYQGIYNVCDTKPTKAKEIVEFLRNEHKIGAVVSKNYSTDTVKGVIGIGGFGSTKTAKTDYRYNDLSIACSNITYDNTKAQRISTFRWKLSNTK